MRAFLYFEVLLLYRVLRLFVSAGGAAVRPACRLRILDLYYFPAVCDEKKSVTPASQGG